MERNLNFSDQLRDAPEPTDLDRVKSRQRLKSLITEREPIAVALMTLSNYPEWQIFLKCVNEEIQNVVRELSKDILGSEDLRQAEVDRFRGFIIAMETIRDLPRIKNNQYKLAQAKADSLEDADEEAEGE